MLSRAAAWQGLRLGGTWSSLAQRRPAPAGMTPPATPTPALPASQAPTPPFPMSPSFRSQLSPSLCFLSQAPDSHRGPRTSAQPHPNLQQDEDIIKEQHALCPQRGHRHRYVLAVLQESACRGAEHILGKESREARGSGTPIPVAVPAPLPASAGSTSACSPSISWRPPAQRWTPGRPVWRGSPTCLEASL